MPRAKAATELDITSAAVEQTTEEQATAESWTAKLMRPFPKEAIRTRDGGRGSQFKYIEGQTAVRRLIEATENNFTFEILRDEIRDHGTTKSGSKQKLVLVWGRLHINGMFRDNMGVQVVTEGGGEDLFKGAITDCFKRCCMMYGMALELYGDDYENPLVSDATRKELIKAWNAVNPDNQLINMSGANAVTKEKFGRLFTELRESEVVAWIIELREPPTKAAF